MRDYGKVSPRFWTGDTGRAMRGKPNVQLVAMYLITAPGSNMIGLFYVPTVIIAHEIGISDTEVRGALDTLGRLGVAHYDHHQELVWIPEMARHQVAETMANGDNRRKAVEREIEPFKRTRHPFANAFIKRYAGPFTLELKPFEEDQNGVSKGDPGGHEPVTKGSDHSPSGNGRPYEGVSDATGTPRKPGSGSGSESGSRTGVGERTAPPPGSSEPIGPGDEPIRLPKGPLHAHVLATVFGRVRAQECPGAFPWTIPANAPGKAESVITDANDHPDVRTDVIPTMVRFFEHAKASRFDAAAKALSDPTYGFACWVSKFTTLREELHGRAPAPPGPQVAVNPHCDFHQKPNSRGKRSFKPSQTCPECKHVALASRPPTDSTPTSVGEILNKKAGAR